MPEAIPRAGGNVRWGMFAGVEGGLTFAEGLLHSRSVICHFAYFNHLGGSVNTIDAPPRPVKSGSPGMVPRLPVL